MYLNIHDRLNCARYCHKPSLRSIGNVVSRFDSNISIIYISPYCRQDSSNNNNIPLLGVRSASLTSTIPLPITVGNYIHSKQGSKQASDDSLAYTTTAADSTDQSVGIQLISCLQHGITVETVQWMHCQMSLPWSVTNVKKP